jgi:hypothetical protein
MDSLVLGPGREDVNTVSESDVVSEGIRALDTGPENSARVPAVEISKPAYKKLLTAQGSCQPITSNKTPVR